MVVENTANRSVGENTPVFSGSEVLLLGYWLLWCFSKGQVFLWHSGSVQLSWLSARLQPILLL